MVTVTALVVLLQFQSSPAPKGGCNSPKRSGGMAAAQAFQSSPAPKGGCNLTEGVHHPVTDAVSILTRPEGRVQRGKAVPTGAT